MPKGAKPLGNIKKPSGYPLGTITEPLPLRKPLRTKKLGPQECSRAQIQERRRSQHIGHVPRHLIGTIMETITTRETIRNQKSGAPRKFQGPNTGKERVSRCQEFAQTP